MTERLYYQDAYLREFSAQVVASSEDGRRVYLDRTAFYPTSGGQPFDVGTIAGARVVEVAEEEDERIAHVLESPVAAGAVEASIDWTRRYDHMQQHTGQHLLSAVLEELFRIPTLSFHMGTEVSTIELGTAALTNEQTDRAEDRCAEIVRAALPVAIGYEDSSEDLGLRKASARTGTLRIISIGQVDKSACGGTHVRSTAEIGAVAIRKLDKVRGNVRIEFVCGARAARAARGDFRTLAEIGRLLSTTAENAPLMIAGLAEKLKAAEKTALKLARDLAVREGKELYDATAPEERGLRKVTQSGAIDDAMRARAQSFVERPKAVFVAFSEEPASVLLAVSKDSGLDAGKIIKTAATAVGGRGGGNAALGQASVPTSEALRAVLAELSLLR